MDLLGRQTELDVYAPQGVMDFITSYLEITGSVLSFPIRYHAIDAGAATVLLETESLTITSVPLNHSVPCVGFIFREKPRKRNIRKDALKNYLLEVEDILRIKDGEDFITAQGERIPNERLTTLPKPSRTYAFITDTAYHAPLIESIRQIDLLYHEATFAENMKRRARQTLHSTASDAARMAAAAQVKKLLIGHYSVRYDNPEVLREEAMKIFTDTELAYEGKTIAVGRNL
jgi:ribonuclease Z